jgi:hypothetical protein
MFADPATLNMAGTPITLTKVNQDGYSTEYRLRNSLEEYRLNIRNSSYSDKKRGGSRVDRHNVEFVQEIFPVAPATASTIRKVYIVVENDAKDSVVNPPINAAALCDFLTANTRANLTKLMNWES